MNNNIKIMNKFLSYVRMGNKLFKIFMKNTDDTKLINLFVDHINKFQEHEKILSEIIEKEGIENAELSFMQKRVLYFYKIKICQQTEDFIISYEALKSITNGMNKSIEFIYRYKNSLSEEFLSAGIRVIDFYVKTIAELQEYLLLNLAKEKTLDN